ncbi:hypothetical protein [Tunturiibacter gelidiferens]|uniref:hypothetical protein n=1 Tax=Tunturiibacter gelidiferens TaxID=3069689 RepID=UPI003D9B7DAE
MLIAKDRPIAFSSAMVLAIRDGLKTQTRRVVKDEERLRIVLPRLVRGESIISPAICAPAGIYKPHLNRHGAVSISLPSGMFGIKPGEFEWVSSYGSPGDRCYVKEATWLWCEKRPNGKTKKGRPKWHYVPLETAPVHYVADGKRPTTTIESPKTGNEWGWRYKVARFMPRHASRIQLEVSGVRIEPLKVISEEDAIAEGCKAGEPITAQDVKDMAGTQEGELALLLLGHAPTAKLEYQMLWESINGEGSWNATHFVWVVTFKRFEANT